MKLMILHKRMALPVWLSVLLFTQGLLLAAADRGDSKRGGALPSDEQLRDYALDLQQISLILNTLVMCNLRQPE